MDCNYRYAAASGVSLLLGLLHTSDKGASTHGDSSKAHGIHHKLKELHDRAGRDTDEQAQVSTHVSEQIFQLRETREKEGLKVCYIVFLHCITFIRFA